MDAGLLLSALLLGLAGTPHCLSMCGAACTGLAGSAARPMAALQLGRLLSYMAGGAFVAASVGGLAGWAQGSAMLRPLWVMLHLGALLLGLYLLWRGRQPAWIENIGRVAPRPAVIGSAQLLAALAQGGAVLSVPSAAPPVVASSGRTWRAGLAGLAWLAWPCGLLQSALLIAALASGPVQGAAVMAGFALSSGLGLLVGPWLLARGLKRGGDMRWAVRLGGAVLASSSIWALGHGVWDQVKAFCT